MEGFFGPRADRSQTKLYYANSSASGNNGATLDTSSAATQSQTWNMDALGNWSSSTTNGAAQTRSFNNQNQITGISGTSATPTYDANGNMTTDQNGNKLIYDAWNRLVAVQNPAGQTIAAYSYNALGYRISESYPQGGNGVAADTVKYLYYSNNWQVLETRVNGTASTDVAHQYVWSQMYIDAMVLRDAYSSGTIQPGQRIYYQHDANFNTTAIVGLVGTTWQVTQRYIYTPYGVVTVLNADWTTAASQIPLTQYLHQGGRQDPITGLYDFRNRDYSPTLGNWIEQDPAGYVNGGNRYEFAASRPAGMVDFAGTKWKWVSPHGKDRMWAKKATVKDYVEGVFWNIYAHLKWAGTAVVEHKSRVHVISGAMFKFPGLSWLFIVEHRRAAGQDLRLPFHLSQNGRISVGTGLKLTGDSQDGMLHTSLTYTTKFHNKGAKKHWVTVTVRMLVNVGGTFTIKSGLGVNIGGKNGGITIGTRRTVSYKGGYTMGPLKYKFKLIAKNCP